MDWIKHGIIWKPNTNLSWSFSHATCPTPLIINEDTLRIYYQSRDKDNVGRIGFIEVDPKNPSKITKEHNKVVLDVGRPGSFDDNGVFQTSIVRISKNTLYLYYVGFEICKNIRYRLLTGLAISEDNGISFNRFSDCPILERSDHETNFRAGPFVIKEKDIFKMWYVAGDSWENINGKEMPIYHLRYIESDDGINWPKKGQVVLNIDQKKEHGFGRPYIYKKNEDYRMHYSIRKRNPLNYRMGYASSKDGIVWKRKDNEIGLTVSDRDWESDSVEYGAEVTIKGKTWLFYNGNDFGKDGIALAELVE